MDVTLIVDGANVMGSRADGWWRDRAGAMARLHGELAALAARGITGPVPGGPTAGGPTAGGAAAGGAADGGAADGGDEPGGRWFPQVVLVVEGRARAVTGLVEPDPGVRVVAARGEGDDEIAGLAGRLSGPRVVVTADRELRRRCEAAGAAVTGPGWLIRQFG
jgi:8-oxo-dGTP diphosphatase